MLKVMNYLDYPSKNMGATEHVTNAKALTLWGYGIRGLDRVMRRGIEWVLTYNGNSICTHAQTPRSHSPDWLVSTNIDLTQMCRIMIISMLFYTVE